MIVYEINLPDRGRANDRLDVFEYERPTEHANARITSVEFAEQLRDEAQRAIEVLAAAGRLAPRP